jgi:uncharacterized protein
MKDEPPQGRPVGYQRWEELLFLHWAIDPAEIQRTLPPGLRVDTWNGEAYVGVVPFFMRRVRPAYLPAVPWLSDFLELNVRTYVRDEEGRAGVWFYSLECDRAIAVAVAQRFFHLPYVWTPMSAQRSVAEVSYHAQRRGRGHEPWRYRWRPHEQGQITQPGTRDFFLVERYRLYAVDRRGQRYVGRVEHEPYQVQEAAVSEWSAGPAQVAGFSLHGPPVSSLTAAVVSVKIYPLEKMKS